MDGVKPIPSLSRPLRVGLIGLGAVGRDVADRLLRGDVPAASLVAISANDLMTARARLQSAGHDVPVMTVPELVSQVDVVCECASVGGFPEIARAVLGAGKILIAISATGMAQCPDIVDLAMANHGRLRVAGGGLPGLDILRAVREDTIESVTLKTTFRPASMAFNPYVLRQGIDLTQPLSKPVPLFSGTGAEAAKAFPHHFNVAFVLCLAGIGMARTRVEVWADPLVEGTVQSVEVKADTADLSMVCRTRPSRVYRSSRIVAPSVIAALRTYVEPVHVGS